MSASALSGVKSSHDGRANEQNVRSKVFIFYLKCLMNQYYSVNEKIALSYIKVGNHAVSDWASVLPLHFGVQL